MTSKDFELIAEVIRYSCPWEVRYQVAQGFARALHEKHPRFDTERFIAAATDNA